MTLPHVIVFLTSERDRETMRHCTETLHGFGLTGVEFLVPEVGRDAELRTMVERIDRTGGDVLIAATRREVPLGAMLTALTSLPVLLVPLADSVADGLETLRSTVLSSAPGAAGTLAIGKAGAINAALLAVAIVATRHRELREKLRTFRADQTSTVLATRVP